MGFYIYLRGLMPGITSARSTQGSWSTRKTNQRPVIVERWRKISPFSSLIATRTSVGIPPMWSLQALD